MTEEEFSSESLWTPIQFWSDSKPFSCVNIGQDFREVTRYPIHSHTAYEPEDMCDICGNWAMFSQSTKYDSFNFSWTWTLSIAHLMTLSYLAIKACCYNEARITQPRITQTKFHGPCLGNDNLLGISQTFSHNWTDKLLLVQPITFFVTGCVYILV